MKIHILQLEGHDDLAAARDKLNFSRAPVTVVVWPKRGRVLTTRLDLLRLARSAGEIGTRLIFVTRDEEVVELAADLAVPVYPSLEVASSAVTAGRRFLLPRLRRPSIGYAALARQRAQLPDAQIWLIRSRWLRAGVFAAGVLAVLVIVALFIPSARIILPLQTQFQNLTIELQASPDFNTPQLSGALPAHQVRVVVEGQDELVSRGEVLLPETYAAVDVEFTNLTTEVVEIPAGTVVRTTGEPPLRFVTERAASLDAKLNSRASVPARALEPGSAGNVAPDRLAAVEGSLGARVSVTNPLAASGGSEQAYPAPAAEDYSILRARLEAVLDRSALKNIKDTLKPGEFLLAGSLERSQVLKDEFLPKEGLPADLLRLTLQGEYTAWAVWSADIDQVARLALDAVLPPAAAALEDTFGVLPLGEPQYQPGQPARWKVFASRTIRADVDENALKQALLGKSPQQARTLLAGQPLAGEPQVILQPSWWFRLPVLPFRIAVEEQP